MQEIDVKDETSANNGWSCTQVLDFQNTFFEVLEELRVKRVRFESCR
jgi:hypothetical protein